MTKIISVVNQKGGVGKTTTAINLAGSFAASELKTLLIDMDSQGNATSGVGIEKTEVEYSVYDLLVEREENNEIVNLDNIIVKPESEEIQEFLDVIPANSDLVSAEYDLFKMMAREMKLKNALEKYKDNYKYIIIDCPPSLSILTINALVASTSVIIPVQCEYFALEGLAELLNTIRTIQKTLNSSLKIEGTLLTMFDSRTNLNKQIANNIRENLAENVFETYIPRNIKISESQSAGVPVLLYDAVCSGAENYLKLVQEIVLNERN